MANRLDCVICKTGSYQLIGFTGALQTGLPGEPALPSGRIWQAFSAPVSSKTGELFVGLSAADWARTLEGWPGFSLLSVKPAAAK